MFSDEAALLKAKIGAVLDLVIRPKEFPLKHDESMHVARMLNEYGEQLRDFARKLYRETTTTDHIVGVTEMVTSKGAKS